MGGIENIYTLLSSEDEGSRKIGVELLRLTLHDRKIYPTKYWFVPTTTYVNINLKYFFSHLTYKSWEITICKEMCRVIQNDYAIRNRFYVKHFYDK